MAPPTRVLVADDDDAMRWALARELTRRGYVVEAAATGRDALVRLSGEPFDVMLLDIHLGDMNGLDVLREIQLRGSESKVVVITAHGDLQNAIEAMRLGASDYLQKPCSVDEIELAIRRASEVASLIERNAALIDGLSTPDVSAQMLGSSPNFLEVIAFAKRVAGTDATALVLGETGVGKDLVARLLHARSPRADKPFVVVDCASLHKELLQSELFGHEKGAFSGANRLKHGLFEVADGGTLFLDEVGEVLPETQAKLLRVLETRKFRRLGGTRELSVDVRLIAATNRDLRRMIRQGTFREDLYFRLCTIEITLPSLRERGDDIALLANHYLERFSRAFGESKQFTPGAIRRLTEYSWPGNIRELIHVVEQGYLVSLTREVGEADLPISGSPPAAVDQLISGELIPLEEIERRYIQHVLQQVGGHRAMAARTLGISERNLYRKLKRYGVS